MGYRLLAGTCVDGDCPSILTDEETGDVILRSRDARDPTVERTSAIPSRSGHPCFEQIGR